MTIEQKAKAYDEAIKRMKSWVRGEHPECFTEAQKAAEFIFPELKESEDERIRKELIDYINRLTATPNNIDKYNAWLDWLEKQRKHLENYDEAEKEKADFVGDGFIECHADFLDFKEGNTYWLEYIGDDKYNVRSDNLLGKTYHITPCQLYTIFKKQTWLEKQDEYELVAKRIEPQPAWSADEATYIHEVETGNGNIKALITEKVKLPKFKVGDWITNGDYTWEVVEIMVLDYVLRSQDGNIVDDTISHTDEQFHLWTIQDAKEGDVLVTKYNQPFIYNGNYDLFNVGAYCGMDCLGEIFIESCTNCQWSSTKVKPATKDQRDALERAMTNAGYRWNKEKLKLERI